MSDDGSPTAILDAWHEAQAWVRRSRGMLHPGFLFSATCAFVAGRFVFGYANLGAWVLLVCVPVGALATAVGLRAKANAIMRGIEKRIGATGAAVLDLREIANELKRETGRLLELKKAFLGAIERRAVHIGGSPEDIQVRSRRLKKAIEDSTPSVEKLSAEVDRLENAFQGAVGNAETPTARWEEFAGAYRQANAELEAVKTGLLH